MNARDDGGNAFPVQKEYDQHGHPLENGADGMSLRDYFAGQALKGILAYNDGGAITVESDGVTRCATQVAVRRRLAEVSYEYADAMISERAK